MGGQQEPPQLHKARRYPDLPEFEGSPGLGRESESHLGGPGSGRRHSSSGIRDHVEETPRGDRILLKSGFHQRQ